MKEPGHSEQELLMSHIAPVTTIYLWYLPVYSTSSSVMDITTAVKPLMISGYKKNKSIKNTICDLEWSQYFQYVKRNIRSSEGELIIIITTSSFINSYLWIFKVFDLCIAHCIETTKNWWDATGSIGVRWGKGNNSLNWRHNGRDGVSTYQPHDCLLNRLFRHKSKNTSNFCVTGLCEGNSPMTGEFPAQMASNAENVSIW